MGNNFASMLVNLFHNAERKIVGIYVLAYVMPLLVAVIDRIPLSGSTIASLISPFGYYAILLPLSMVFFGPFFVPFPLAHVLGILASIMFLVSFLSYPVISYLLLRGNGAGWIISFIYSLATIGLNVFIIGAIPEMAVVWVFGITMNFVILCLLHSCRNEFLY
jgi:hypothetical protein